VMEDFDLTHRLHGVTFDNASNNANMMAHWQLFNLVKYT
jgi:hypothetical protein